MKFTAHSFARKSLTCVVLSLFSAAVFLACTNAAGGGGNSGGHNPETDELEVNIVAQTFAGQVYYLDEISGRSAARIADPAPSIDTTRDRIVFSESGNTYELFIGDKKYEGTYSVDLTKREISISGKDSENASVDLTGVLKYAPNAKTADFVGTEKKENGVETKIEKKAEIKWDWSELGNWKQEQTLYYHYVSNIENATFPRTGNVQLWRGEIDFTNAAYTKGVKIPESVFSSAKEGDCIAFLWPDDGPRFSFKTDGTVIKSREWAYAYVVENYNYWVYRLTSENLAYIKENHGLNLYGNGAVLEGIIVGEEDFIESAVKDFFSRQYHFGPVNDNYEFHYSYYVDTVHDQYVIDIDVRTQDKVDRYGLSRYSTDKSIFRKYYGRGKLSSFNGTVKMNELVFVPKSQTLDKPFVTERKEINDKGEPIWLNEYVDGTFDMILSIEKLSNEDAYNLRFVNVPDYLKSCLETLDYETFKLTYCPYMVMARSNEEITVQYDDISKTGSWKTENIKDSNGKSHVVKKWEGELDYTNSGFRKGLYIPKDKFSGIEAGGVLYLLYPEEVFFDFNCIDVVGQYDYDMFVNKNSYYNKGFGVGGLVLSEYGVEYAKTFGLNIAIDGKKILGVAIMNTKLDSNSYINIYDPSNSPTTIKYNLIKVVLSDGTIVDKDNDGFGIYENNLGQASKAGDCYCVSGISESYYTISEWKDYRNVTIIDNSENDTITATDDTGNVTYTFKKK